MAHVDTYDFELSDHDYKRIRLLHKLLRKIDYYLTESHHIDRFERAEVSARIYASVAGTLPAPVEEVTA